jgi:hypothetical protein
MNTKKTRFNAFLALIFTPTFLLGTTIVSDDFSAATFDSNTGIISSVLDYGPISNTTNTFFNVGSEDGNPGQFLNYGHTSGTTSFFTADLPSSIGLSEIGDWAQISLDIRSGTGSSGNRIMRFGLFESGDTLAESRGFFVAGGGNNSRLAADLSTVSDEFLVNGPSVSTGDITGSNITGGWDSAFLRIEKTAADQFTLTSTFAGLTFDPFIVTSTSDFQLDQLRIGIFNRSITMEIDNLVVTAIPEPGTLALVGIALGSLLLFRRRKV